jgi:hypothetical protein
MGATTQTTFGTSALTTAAIDTVFSTAGAFVHATGKWRVSAAAGAACVFGGDRLLEAVAPEFHGHDNLAVASSDSRRSGITAPQDRGCPARGGNTVGTLYNVVASGFGRTSNTSPAPYTSARSIRGFNGMLFSLQRANPQRPDAPGRRQ